MNFHKVILEKDVISDRLIKKNKEISHEILISVKNSNNIFYLFSFLNEIYGNKINCCT